ncbi:MAG: hypothetical protein WC028_12305 [Candidatus Obscuribacterales bacterium]|jgi:hypothetical protein
MKSTIKKNAEALIVLGVLLLVVGSVWMLFADTMIVAVSVTAIGGAILGLVGTVQAELLDDALTLTMESDTLKAV